MLLVCRHGAARFVKSLLCCLIFDTLRKLDRAVENILISSKFACVIIKSQPSRALSKSWCFASSFEIALYSCLVTYISLILIQNLAISFTCNLTVLVILLLSITLLEYLSHHQKFKAFRQYYYPPKVDNSEKKHS